MWRAFTLLRDAFSEWNADKASRLAGNLAFSAIFSLAPLLVITIAIVGQLLGFAQSPHPHTQVENELLARVGRAAGPQAADTLRQLITASFGHAGHGTIAQIVGWMVFVVGASGVFLALQDALNAIWHVEPQQRSIWLTIRERAAAVGVLLLVALVLVVSFLANALIALLSGPLEQLLPVGGATLLTLADPLVSVVVATLLFALIYRFLPDAPIGWDEVWSGAALTAVLFVLGQALIAFYLSRAGIASAYGAAGSFLVLLLWIYYSSMILLFGAELTKVVARSTAPTPVPA